MPRLSDIDPSEVGLVVRGANRRRFSVLKADDAALDATFAAVLTEKADGEEQLMKQLADGDAEAGRAAVAAYRLLKAHADELPDEIRKAIAAIAAPSTAGDELDVTKADYTSEQRAAMGKDGEALPDGSYPIANRTDLEKAVHAVGRGNAPHADIRAHIAKRAKELGATELLPDSWKISKEDLNMADTATVPVKKEDGTWDLTGVPEEQHEFMKALLEKADRAETAEAEKAELEKAAADAEASKDDALKVAEEARAIAKSEQDRRETAEFIAKAEELGEASEFGPVLKAIAGGVDAETFEKLEAVLKANHERAEQAGLYAEIGKRAGGGTGGDAEAQLLVKAEEIRKADTSLSREQALAKAYEDNPELYAKLSHEEG